MKENQTSGEPDVKDGPYHLIIHIVGWEGYLIDSDDEEEEDSDDEEEG